ncbi:ABC transporter permease [Bosea sp. 2KB_26]|uniref:ABC transporter permease n=1 Tax=unclassified Bosea (in: a-proteobacteria) TaxID=2653178 RepID=UPI00086A4C3D|nr:ABC transporter permease [Bosea sp. BIWAKO-01]GAU84590.1 hydroxymethylpyrimidine ABC transporter transmembrane component [Bosea sp. BIWAKO-01]
MSNDGAIAPAAASSATSVPATGHARAWVSAIAWPLASFAVLLLAWQWFVPMAGIPEYILPVPSAFFERLWIDRALIAQHTLVTANEIVLGFLMAAVISIPLGYIIVSVKILEKAIYPVIVFFQLVPKIAIAPLFVVWFGFGLFPKVLLTFLLCFFPTLVASMTGFRALDERVLYLTRSMGASAWQTFRYVRVPAALTYIFSGLKVSAVFAATGAIVGEFVGANAGLGYLLLRGTSFLDMPLIFACLVALSLVGIVFSYLVDGLEVLLMPWQRKG